MAVVLRPQPHRQTQSHRQTQTHPLPALSPPTRTALLRAVRLPLVAPSGVRVPFGDPERSFYEYKFCAYAYIYYQCGSTAYLAFCAFLSCPSHFFPSVSCTSPALDPTPHRAARGEQVEGEQAEGDVCPACTAAGGGSVTLAYSESLVSAVWGVLIRRTGSRLATRVPHTTLKTAPQTTIKPKTPPMRKLPQTQTPNRKAHTSSPPALTPSLSATSRPSAFRPSFV
ncbi:hypothetical protein B0H13DRAFT_343702 [Mycena leptocephala]|nr:hypothetical protein B0H13DRAFT_343702 [Mycena leptocephala]